MKWEDIHRSPPVIVTAPSIEPVTTAEAKTHLRVEVTDDDSYIGDVLIPSARWMVEHHTSQALINTVYDVTADRFPDGIELPLPRWPLVSVTSVTTYNASDVAATFAASSYLVDTASHPGRIVLNDGQAWPSDLRRRNAVVIRFTAGYGTTVANVTTKALWARHAMLFLIGWWYQRREPVVVGHDVSTPLPLTWDALIAPGRHYAIA